MNYLKLILIFFIISGCVANDTWTVKEKKLETTFMVLHTIDTLQTEWALENGYREVNPILGDHPSDLKLGIWYGAIGLGHLIISDHCNHYQRKTWQWATIVFKSIVVFRNKAVGARIEF